MRDAALVGMDVIVETELMQYEIKNRRRMQVGKRLHEHRLQRKHRCKTETACVPNHARHMNRLGIGYVNPRISARSPSCGLGAEKFRPSLIRFRCSIIWASASSGSPRSIAASMLKCSFSGHTM